MSYRDQNWSGRFASLGDQAEGEFIKWARRTDLSIERLGWDRPKMGVRRMALELRHIPDFYASDGNLYEVVGMGRDGILKGIKTEKWDALRFWNGVQTVRVFVYNSSKDVSVMLPWPTLVQLVARARRDGIKAFANDGNTYYPIRWDWIEPYTVGDTE